MGDKWNEVCSGISLAKPSFFSESYLLSPDSFLLSCHQIVYAFEAETCEMR